MTRKLALPALLLVLLATSCGERDVGGERGLVLGAVLPLSGPDGRAGEEILVGLDLAASAAGPGPPLRLRVVDGEGAPLPSTRRYRTRLTRSPAPTSPGPG